MRIVSDETIGRDYVLLALQPLSRTHDYHCDSSLVKCARLSIRSSSFFLECCVWIFEFGDPWDCARVCRVCVVVFVIVSRSVACTSSFSRPTLHELCFAGARGTFSCRL